MWYTIHRKTEKERLHTMAKKSKMDKMVEANRKKSMSKKALDEYNKAQRTHITWNTGTRVFKSAKDYNRQAFKRDARMAVYD